MNGNRLIIKDLTINIKLIIDIGRNIELETLKGNLNGSNAFQEISWDTVMGRMYHPLYYENLKFPLKIVYKEITIECIDKSYWESKVLLMDKKIVGPLLYTKVYEKGVLSAFNGLKISPIIKIFHNGTLLLIIPLRFSGRFEVDDIIGIINPIIYQDVPFIIDRNKKVSLRDLILNVRKIILDICPKVLPRIKEPLNEKINEYTTIQVHEFENRGYANELFEKFEKDFKGLFIRAIKHYRDVHDIIPEELREVPVNTLKNQALEKTNILNANYKSTFLYFPFYGDEYIEEVYLRPIQLLLVQSYLLMIYDILLSDATMNFLLEEKQDKIKEDIIKLEGLRKEILNYLEDFKTFTPSAYRVRYVFDIAKDMFRTMDLYNNVRMKLEDLGALLSRSYDMLERQRSQRMTIAMNILSIIFAGALSFSLMPSLVNFLEHYGIFILEYTQFPLSIILWVVTSLIAVLYIKLVT